MSKQTLKKHDESYCRLSANSNSLKFNHSCLIRNECTQIMGSSDHCSPASTLKFAGKVFKGISFQQPKSEKALKSFYTTDFSSFFLQPVTQKNELGPLVITCNSISLNALQYLPIGFTPQQITIFMLFHSHISKMHAYLCIILNIGGISNHVLT